MPPRPYRIDVPESVLADLHRRLDATRFPEPLPGGSPRRWLEARFDLRRYTEMPRGGHLAAAEAPQPLLEDVRAFFRTLR
jgi:hypothetical protein